MISGLSAPWLSASVKPSMKRYLTGIDWIIHSLDYAGKVQSGIGNLSCVVIELRSETNSRIIDTTLRKFLQNFSIINGLPGRGINLCPYWKTYPLSKMLPCKVDVIRLEDDANPLLLLVAEVNKPFQNKREHLKFTIIHSGKRSFLGMTFDHRILDARGAEAFLDLFQRFYQKEVLPQFSFDEPAHLNHWKEKFIAGRQVNRVFLDLARKTPRLLPTPLRSRLCKFRAIDFDSLQASRFTDAAYTQAGYLMLMPYALAKSVEVMHRIFEARNIPGLTYIIPVSIDTRAQQVSFGDIFFNHVSFFFFKIHAENVTSFPLLLAQIKEQMYEQVKSGLPEAIKKVTFLLRIAPLPLVNFFMHYMSRKHIASFCFSFVGSAYNAGKFAEEEVLNIFHLPRVPNPPGVGIFFNQFNGRLNATLSYFEGVLSEAEADQIASQLKVIGDEG